MAKQRIAAALVAALLFVGSGARAADPELIRPRSCLVMPWEMTGDFQSYAHVSNKSGKNLVTHWSYWAASCDKLADVTVCLTPNGGHVMDSSAVQNSVWVDGQSENRGDPVNLRVAADARGVDANGTLYVSAYEATPGDFLDCLSSGVLVDSALIGRWVTANTVAAVSAGGNAEGFGLSSDGLRCELPDVTLGSLTVQTFAPVRLTQSSTTVYVAEEDAGEDSTFAGELGPACRRRGAFPRPCLVQAGTAFYNDEEVRTSLPDLLFGCSTKIDLTEGITAAFGTGGTFVVDMPVVVPTDLQLPAHAVGGTTWAGAFDFQGVGPFGIGHAAWIGEGLPEPTPTECPPERQIIDPLTGQVIGCLPAPPTPTPVVTPSPTPITCPAGTQPIIDPVTGLVIGCVVGPTATPGPTPAPSPTSVPLSCPVGFTPIFDPITGAITGCIPPPATATPAPTPTPTPTAAP